MDSSLLPAALISGNSLCHVVLDIVIIVCVVAAMAAIRSEELGSDLGNVLGHRVNFGIRYDCAASPISGSPVFSFSTIEPRFRLAGA